MLYSTAAAGTITKDRQLFYRPSRTGVDQMLLTVVGGLDRRLARAIEIAQKAGTTIRYVEGVPEAVCLLSSGEPAHVLLVDAEVDIRTLCAALQASKIQIPVVACGFREDIQYATKALEAGATEYVPLPDDADSLAVLLKNLVIDDRSAAFGELKH